MNKFLASWGIGVLVAGWASAQPGQGDGARVRDVIQKLPPVLRQAIRVAPNLKFSGTRVVEQFAGADREQHVEYVLREGNHLRIWFPNDSAFSGQVIVETPRQRRHYFPGKNEIHVGPPRREEAFGRLVASATSGRAVYNTEPGGTIAGRETVAVTVHEGGNPVQKLWIDSQSGMILRRDLFDAVGVRIGSYAFTEIDYSPVVRPGDFELNRKGAKIVTPEDEARILARRLQLYAASLPSSDGWRLDSARTIRSGSYPVLHLTFRKGTSYVSLFQAKGRIELPMLRRARQGALSSHTWVAGGNTFAIIGNVAVDELKRLANLVSVN